MSEHPAINVTNIDFDGIKVSLKNYLQSQEQFKDYDFESSTLSILLDILSYNTYYNAIYANMIGNEMFLDSAQLRENVVSRAKMLDYVPRSARGASTTANVAITPSGSPDSVTVSKNTEFTATVDGVTYTFVTPTDYTFTSAESYSGTITIVEGVPNTERFTVSTANPSKYILSNPNIDTTSITVQIQNSVLDSTTETFTLATDLVEVGATSPVYFLQEVDGGLYEIYFGDGILGKQLQNDNIIIVSYRVCNGSDANQIVSFSNPATLGGSTTFTVSINEQTSGGSNIESIDSIKFNAPKRFETQNRVVVADDYKRLILSNFGDIQSISVWGGEENTPAIFGRVFISAKPFNKNILSQTQKDEIVRFLDSYTVLSIEPEFVDATFLYVRPTITVKYNKDATTSTAEQVQTNVLNAIVNFESTKLGTFENKTFYYSQFVRAVDDADTSIIGNITDIKLEKRFVPSLIAPTTYRISFNNQIRKPISEGHESHSGHHFIRSSAFTFQGKRCFLDDDGNGNMRIYYIQGSDTVIYVNENAGTVDYAKGLITLNSFSLTDFEGSELSIFVTPVSYDIKAVRNQIMLIAGANVTVENFETRKIEAVTRQATTQGVTATVVDSGINSVVY